MDKWPPGIRARGVNGADNRGMEAYLWWWDTSSSWLWWQFVNIYRIIYNIYANYMQKCFKKRRMNEEFQSTGKSMISLTGTGTVLSEDDELTSSRQRENTWSPKWSVYRLYKEKEHPEWAQHRLYLCVCMCVCEGN